MIAGYIDNGIRFGPQSNAVTITGKTFRTFTAILAVTLGSFVLAVTVEWRWTLIHRVTCRPFAGW